MSSYTGSSILEEALTCIGQRIGYALLQTVDQNQVHAASLQNEVVGIS